MHPTFASFGCGALLSNAILSLEFEKKHAWYHFLPWFSCLKSSWSENHKHPLPIEMSQFHNISQSLWTRPLRKLCLRLIRNHPTVYRITQGYPRMAYYKKLPVATVRHSLRRSWDRLSGQIKHLQTSNHLGVSKNNGTPKWMVKIMENPIKMDDLEGKHPYLWFNTHLRSELQLLGCSVEA